MGELLMEKWAEISASGLAKLTKMLRSLAELFLNRFGEENQPYDVIICIS